MDIDFSRVLEPTAFKTGLKNRMFEATPEECEAVAKRIGLLSLKNYSVTLDSLDANADNEFKIKGKVKASVVQPCVLTLEPVTDEINDEFILRLIPGLSEEELEELDEGDENEEDIEPLLEGGVNIGDISTQYLSMALNPFPRSEGADIKDINVKGAQILSEEDVKTESNPFKVLGKLKNEA